MPAPSTPSPPAYCPSPSGEATKTVPYAMDGEKVYRFTCPLGEGRDTDDSQGRIIAEVRVRPRRSGDRGHAAALHRRHPPGRRPSTRRSRSTASGPTTSPATARRSRLDPRWIRMRLPRRSSRSRPGHGGVRGGLRQGRLHAWPRRDLGRALGTCGHRRRHTAPGWGPSRSIERLRWKISRRWRTKSAARSVCSPSRPRWTTSRRWPWRRLKRIGCEKRAIGGVAAPVGSERLPR